MPNDTGAAKNDYQDGHQQAAVSADQRRVEAQNTLLKLVPLVKMRIGHRLGNWPIGHREDVEQDCLVKLLRVVNDSARLARIVTLEAFSQRVVDNAINDAIKDHARQRRMVLLDDELDQEDAMGVEDDPADASIDHEIAAGAMLTKKQRRLFELRRTLGSTAAVAEALDISTQTASERLSRLFRALRQHRHGDRN